MANIKSAIKRIQVSERNRLRNKSCRSAVKTFTKRYFDALDAYAASPDSTSLAAAQSALSAAFSQVDKAVKRGVYHRNAGARRKARLSKAFKTIESQQTVAS